MGYSTASVMWIYILCVVDGVFFFFFLGLIEIKP